MQIYSNRKRSGGNTLMLWNVDTNLSAGKSLSYQNKPDIDIVNALEDFILKPSSVSLISALSMCVCGWVSICFGVRLRGSDCCVELSLAPIKTTALDSSRTHSQGYSSSVPCTLPAIQFSLCFFFPALCLSVNLSWSRFGGLGVRTAANSKRLQQRKRLWK